MAWGFCLTDPSRIRSLMCVVSVEEMAQAAATVQTTVTPIHQMTVTSMRVERATLIQAMTAFKTAAARLSTAAATALTRASTQVMCLTRRLRAATLATHCSCLCYLMRMI